MDDTERWKVAAAEDPMLPAAELYFMARPDERVAWRDDSWLPVQPPLGRWGRRRPRSRAASVKGDPGSPKTPLSWSGGSASTGSGGEGEGGVGSPAEKEPRVAGPCAGAGGGSAAAAAGGGSGKVEEEGVVARRGLNAVAMSEEPGVPTSKAAAARRHGKKMTVRELKEEARLLSENNVTLRKELEVHKMSIKMLIEENKRLKSLEAKLQHQVVTDEAKPSECSRLPFDLNLPYPEESDFMDD